MLLTQKIVPLSRTGHRGNDADIRLGRAGAVDDAGGVEKERRLAPQEGGPGVVLGITGAGRAHRPRLHHVGIGLNGLDVAVPGEGEFAIGREERAAVVQDGAIDVVRTAGVARGDEAVFSVGGRCFRDLLELGPGGRDLLSGGLQQVLPVVPDPNVDAPGQSDVMVVVAQRIDRSRLEIVEVAGCLQIRDDVVERADRALIVELDRLIASPCRYVGRRARADRGQEGLVPVVPRDGSVFDLDAGMGCVEFVDEPLGGVDILRRPPDHVPEAQLDRLLGGGGDGGERDKRSAGESAQRAAEPALGRLDHPHERISHWVIGLVDLEWLLAVVVSSFCCVVQDLRCSGLRCAAGAQGGAAVEFRTISLGDSVVVCGAKSGSEIAASAKRMALTPSSAIG